MMEQQSNQQEDNNLFELQVDYESGNYFKETAKWAKFIGIVMLIFMGLYGLYFLAFGSLAMQVFGIYSSILGTGAGLIIGIFVIVFAISIFLYIQIYRFGAKVKAGLTYNDQTRFNVGLRSLKNFFLVSGILTLLYISFLVLIILFALF